MCCNNDLVCSSEGEKFDISLEPSDLSLVQEPTIQGPPRVCGVWAVVPDSIFRYPYPALMATPPVLPQ
jgi:hypothetical protein